MTDLSNTPEFKAALSQKVGQGQAHSKIILMGEHAVVYDFPAIALPFPAAQAKVTARRSETDDFYLVSRIYSGPLKEAPENLDNIKQAVKSTIQSFKLPTEALHLTIESSIPEGRGMGSSAAVAVAIVRAITDLYDKELPDYLLRLIVNQAEVIAHGSTSGLDTLVTSTDTAYLYRKSQQPVPFQIDLDGYLVLADSGQIGQTKEAVGKVHVLKSKKESFVKDVMGSIGNFVMEAKKAIEQKNLVELGRLMTYNHYYLNQLEVSNPELDSMINAAWMKGALGAKLTGAGLGGCVISLTDSKEKAQDIADVMMEVGAVQTWTLSLAK